LASDLSLSPTVITEQDQVSKINLVSQIKLAVAALSLKWKKINLLFTNKKGGYWFCFSF